MPTTVSFIEHTLCVTMVIIMTAVPIRPAILTPSLSPITPDPLSSSFPLQPVEEPLKRGEAENYHFPPEFVQDYGFWNPTPYFDRGNAAPIPHSQAVEQNCRDSSMPNSLQTDKNNMAPEETP